MKESEIDAPEIQKPRKNWRKEKKKRDQALERSLCLNKKNELEERNRNESIGSSKKLHKKI